MNCPICDKAGLSENATSCPQCESDLSGYILIEKIRTQQGELEERHQALSSEVVNEKVKKRNLVMLSSVLLLACLGFGAWLYTSQGTKIVDDNHTKVLRDSFLAVIEEKDAQINSFENEKVNAKDEEIAIKYVIKKGDNLMKIARFFYNDEARYHDIVETNNLTANTPILIGDTLTLNLKN